MTLSVQVIDKLDESPAFLGSWTALLAASADNSLTLTWEWLATWWRAYGAERQLRLVTVRDGSALIGAAPLLLRQRPFVHHGLIPFRRLELMASGEGPGQAICSDYIGWLAVAGRESEVVAAILDHLQAVQGAEWDELVLPDVWEGSAALSALRSTLDARGLRQEIRSRAPSPYIQLPSTFDQFLAGLGSNLRYQIRRGRKELAKVGGRYRVIEQADELPAAFETLVKLHQARWTARGESGAFADEKRRAFHEAILPLALARGWLRLGILETPSGPIGAIYNFRYNGRVYFYQSGIEPQSNSNLRPGMLLHALEIEAAIAAGDREYDFLKRGDSDYKDHWANASRDLICLRVAKPSLKQHLLSAARATYKTAADWRRRRAPAASAPQEPA